MTFVSTCYCAVKLLLRYELEGTLWALYNKIHIGKETLTFLLFFTYKKSTTNVLNEQIRKQNFV